MGGEIRAKYMKVNLGEKREQKIRITGEGEEKERKNKGKRYVGYLRERKDERGQTIERTV